ncbi:hypothetical protein LOK49_LG01G02674 [Camellia lanceoleosa]|uniref:Uncharacterized protein n=1 Tax=Camellia lanceoleosa TaxID=1840588 RepID=A0ACC0J071_9ERIC|nr:hypothetical protein LOK49_LG01G02674 [Camellia lanceoleosa]
MGMEKKMIEQAEEELEILEAQHPNRFEYLKIELKSLIFLLHSQNITLSNNNNNNNFNKSYNFLSSSSNSILLPASSTATTQASSSNKKRKKGTSEMQRTEQPPSPKHKIQRADWEESLCSNRRDGVEVAIERAQACLLKIQQFKTSFY